MRSVLSLITLIYRTVNVASIQALIGGGVYRGKAPSSNNLDNVEIISGANVNDIVQDGTLFVNYHAADLQDGQQDQSKFNSFATLLLPLLEADANYDVIDDDTFINDQRPGWSYYSARVRVYSFNDNYVE